MAAPLIPPIPINALVAYDAMPPGGVFLLSLPHPTIPDQRVFGAVDKEAFPYLKVAAPTASTTGT